MKYSSVTPYLIVNDPSGVSMFLQKVFNAKERLRHKREDETIRHIEVVIGNGLVMLGGANKDFKSLQAMIYLLLDSTDSYYNKALAHGAESVMAPFDADYGNRDAGVKDKEGNVWWISSFHN